MRQIAAGLGWRLQPQITSEEILATIAELGDLNFATKKAESRKKEIKTLLKNMLTTEEKPKFKGKVGSRILSISQRKGRQSCNVSYLKENFPEAFQASVKKGASYSVVELK